MNSTIFYFGRINSYIDKGLYGPHLHIGPAYQKAMSILGALREAKIPVVMVSVPVHNSTPARRKRSPVVSRESGIPWCSLGLVQGRLLSRLYASIAFFAFAIRLGRTGEIILYNFFPEYIFAALFRRFVGRPCILDIEDAPRSDELTAAGVSGHVSFLILKSICAARYLTVSHKVGVALNLGTYVPVYGAVSERSIRKPKSLRNRKPSQKTALLYGGSLLPETGVDVFVDFLHACTKNRLLTEKIRIYVTGFGQLFKLTNIIEELRAKGLEIDVFEDLDYKDYCRIIFESDVGICLKIPGTQMADTTFPSKVVELLRNGLLTISTPVSDVPLLFKNGGIILLEKPYAASLLAAVEKIVTNPAGADETANMGFELAKRIFSAKKLGQDIANFVRMNNR